jgi:hypothetical protein
MSDFVSAVMGVIVGSLVAFLVAKFYYEKAARELDDQIRGLKQLMELMLQAIEAGGFAKVYRHESGRPTRVVIDIPRMIVEDPDRARRVLAAIGIGLEFVSRDADD